jgi:hypothetical protein
MVLEYSVDLCKRLQRCFSERRLHRPLRVDRYDAGDTLEYVVAACDAAATTSRVRLEVERFVGGGFAGQVYKVRVLDTEGALDRTLVPGRSFALKILIPPSSFARWFRNLLYAVGFQGSFQPQTNPTAARAGALWQTFIRRAARIRFGDESCVNEVHGTLVDHSIGSCGEISDWIDGRTWRLEVDNRVDLLRRWLKGKPVDHSRLGSPEFRAKRRFMSDFVELLNDVGAHEFARQYEWSTWKSQPNCLKRTSTEDDPERGVTAVDFRAGLALLPFLPMSPGDFVLILKGLARGSPVQFDRGDLRKLGSFVAGHAAEFDDLQELLPELRRADAAYRDSLIDLTHHHVRLVYDRRLWRTILDGAVGGWRTSGVLDERQERRFRGRTVRVALFAVLGLIPILGTALRKAWGRADWRAHYRSMLTSAGYLRRALAGKMAERAIGWHRDGRVSQERAERVSTSPLSFAVHTAVSWLPAGLHRSLTDGAHLRQRLHSLLVRPVRLYFNRDLREQWLRDMVQEGRRKRIVTDDDADVILSRIHEPFIQRYLKSLAVHVCTVPVTQVVSLVVAAIYILTHPELPRAQAWAIGFGIVALFQVVPISPGSLVRGLYVVYLVVRERNFKDYNIAVFLGFFKYVGYLAFPIQMAHRYPTLARFMAAHWATDAVHVVPVFGEHGALLEHKVFTAFYNLPLTLRGRMGRRAVERASRPPRRWHLPPLAAGVGCALGAVQLLWGRYTGQTPALGEIWWATLTVALLCGALFTLLAGGAALGRRIAGATVCGIATGLAFAAVSAATGTAGPATGDLVAESLWRVFVLGVLSPIGAILTELALPEP